MAGCFESSRAFVASLRFSGLCLLALMFIAPLNSASGLTYASIEGKWCTSGGIITFTRKTMIVSFYDKTPSRRYNITKYKPADTTVTVEWMRDREEQTTDYSEFSADGKIMVQMPQASGDKGPRREFRRC
jgi:hypothetical protein